MSQAFITLDRLRSPLDIGAVPVGAAESLPYLLVNPPLTDPTAPYHSISYLLGATTAAGFARASCLDANVESLNYLSQPEHVRGLLAESERVRHQIEQQAGLTRADELRYRAALAGRGLHADFMERALHVFRDEASFYHYDTYRQAVMACRRWLELLSLRGAPGMFDGFALRTRGVLNFASHRDLRDPAVHASLTGPLRPYLDGPYRETLACEPWRLIGFSVNYLSQLPFALAMAASAREACPDAVIVFGGTEVCDDVKFAAEPKHIWQLFRDADLLVPGEGESALVGILRSIALGGDPGQIPGVMSRSHPGSPAASVYEDLDTLPTPLYDVWNWPAYWSPEPVVLYSPTRGCYWNKCTFCDYGLNSDRPTYPSRERPTQGLLSDLKAIRRTGSTVYFAVDAMSPRFLRQLAAVLRDADLGLKWSAELRLERTIPKRGLGGELSNAGCVAISFGYESASQRILDLIDKGVQIDQVPAILQELRQAGIGAQMMGFTGFPSETVDEARETYEFLMRHQDLWAIAGIGTFVLTQGSIVAKQPARFGIELIEPSEPEDVERFIAWRDSATGSVHYPGEASEDIRPDLRRSLVRVRDDRPFVGGIDSGHSILYFARYGRQLLPTGQEASALYSADFAIVPESLYETPFPRCLEFTTTGELEEGYEDLQGSGGSVSHDRLQAWLDQPSERSALRGPRTVRVEPNGVLTPAIDPGSSPHLAALALVLSSAQGAR